MSVATITVVSNLEDVLSSVRDAQTRTLARIGEMIQWYARDEIQRPKLHADGDIRPNVVTGDLYRSIVVIMEADGTRRAAYIGTELFYGKFVELGTFKTWSYPFLRPAATDHASEYKAVAEQEFRNFPSL